MGGDAIGGVGVHSTSCVTGNWPLSASFARAGGKLIGEVGPVLASC